ncbi:MAG: diacylglycerol kinase [Waddliaceae bacterium]|nr:diacylglycerol kinase [Waddliaceae bacterium]
MSLTTCSLTPLCCQKEKYSTIPPGKTLKTEKKKLRFIINPNSGTTNKKRIEAHIRERIDTQAYDFNICYTKAPLHACELTKEAVKEGCDVVIAVGGDGTVHEVGCSLINTKTALGIIPCGSGNGLARHLNIPTSVKRAIDIINRGKTKKIDTVKINDRSYLGMAGVGFDGHIAWEFSKTKTRGFWPYIKLVIKELPKYKAQNYTLTLDGKKVSRTATLISFANSAQYGNEIAISPQAKIDDGMIDVAILEDLPLWALAPLAVQLCTKTMHYSPHLEIIRAKSVKIEGKDMRGHVDGEPAKFDNGLELTVNPKSLYVAVP